MKSRPPPQFFPLRRTAEGIASGKGVGQRYQPLATSCMRSSLSGFLRHVRLAGRHWWGAGGGRALAPVGAAAGGGAGAGDDGWVAADDLQEADRLADEVV